MCVTASLVLAPCSAVRTLTNATGLVLRLRAYANDRHEPDDPCAWWLLDSADAIARMAASLGAIHWNAGRSDADRATLLAICDECEHAVPELASLRQAMKPNVEMSHANPKNP